MMQLQKGVNTTVEFYVSSILDRIKRLRLEKGFTQSDVGFKLGLSAQGYRYLEIGERELSLSRLCEISAALKTSLTILLGLEDLETPVVKNLLAEKDHVITDLQEQLQQKEIIFRTLIDKINSYEQSKP